MNNNNNFVDVRDVETNGLYSANFGRAVYPFERHHIIPYMTCMGNNDVELACDAMNNSVDLPKSIHIKLHKYLADNGYPKHVAFSESEYGNIRELTYEFLVEYTDLLDDYYNPNIPMDVVIRKYNDSIGDGKSDAWSFSSDIVAKYESGMSTTHLGNEYDVNPATINHILTANGVVLRNNSECHMSDIWNHADDIVAKYESGMSTTHLGNEYGVAKNTINRVLTANGVELRASVFTKTDAWEFVDDIIAKYESGMSTCQLGNEYGVDRGTINRILTANDVELRSSNIKSNAWEFVDDIVREYESAMSQAALARKYGVSRPTIRSILVSAGAI